MLQKLRKLKWNCIKYMRTINEKCTKDEIEWCPKNEERQRGGQIKICEEDLPKGRVKSVIDRET